MNRKDPPALPAPAEAGARLARAGGRIAAAGWTALATAGRLRQIRQSAGPCAERERALLLRDLFGRLLALHGVEVRASGPLPLGPALLASNHVSYLDPLAVGSLVPCVPVSKLEVAAWPIVGTFARELGVIFVARGDQHSGMRVMRQAARAFKKGLPVLNFPEGTTTDGGRVLPFCRGLFGLARRLAIPVIPVALQCEPARLAWVDDDTFLPHYLRLAGDAGAAVYVQLGEAVPSRDFASAADLAWSVQLRIEDMLGGDHAAAAG